MNLPSGIRRVIVTGSRDWSDREVIEQALMAVWHRAAVGCRPTLVHGGQRGADSYAHSWALRNGWLSEVHPANWQRYGRRAGPVRNAEMIEAGADLLVAFVLNGSRGASGCAAMAASKGIPVWRVVRPESAPILNHDDENAGQTG